MVILRKLYYFIPRSALLIINKSFIQTCLDYGDIVYDQPSYASFTDKIESLQYNVALAINGTISETLRIKHYPNWD